MITVRPESAYNSRVTQPFEMGIRHLRVACCDGEQATLVNMARERIIYRPFDEMVKIRKGDVLFEERAYDRLTYKQRAYHLIVGLAETVGAAGAAGIIGAAGAVGSVAAIGLGFLALAIPYIVAQIELKDYEICATDDGAYSIQLYENGRLGSPTRRNPFHPNADQDSFYLGASWKRA